MRISDTTFLGIDPAATSAPHKNRFATNRTAGTMPEWKPKVQPVNFAPSQLVSSDVQVGKKPGFNDLVDIINPLQHIPVVGHYYRKMTGDEISPTAQFIGSTLFGGPLGAAAAITDIAIREQTGKGSIDTVMGFLGNSSTEETSSPIHLTKRKAEAPRTAGTMPIWGRDNNRSELVNQTNPIPGSNLASQTNFSLLLNGLANQSV